MQKKSRISLRFWAEHYSEIRGWELPLVPNDLRFTSLMAAVPRGLKTKKGKESCQLLHWCHWVDGGGVSMKNELQTLEIELKG